MPEINTSLLPGQRNFSGPEPTGLRHACGKYIKRPIEWLRSALFSHNNPKDILGRIQAAAEKGLEKAATDGVRIINLEPNLNSTVTQALQHMEAGSAVPQAENAQNSQEKAILQDKLTRKFSVFNALLQMRDAAGIQDPNNLKLMALVNKATEGENPPSVWQLFTSHYGDRLGFFEILFAAWVYWIYYMTSLIDKTIGTYLGAVIDKMTADLESDSKRKTVFSSLVEQSGEFFVDDIAAARKYAYGEERGSLEKIRNNAVDSYYGFNLEVLCQDFSAYLVDSYLVEENKPPTVEFFNKKTHEIPIIGQILTAFVWLINRFIIQRVMKNSILPAALLQGVKKGLEATQPNKLPFAIALTEFFTTQLKKLRDTLDTEQYSPPADPLFEDDEMLRATIELLMQDLKLEGKFTPSQLQKRIESSLGWVDGKVLTEFKESLIEASNTLFQYLDTTARSGELVNTLLSLSLKPFSYEDKTEAMLEAEFNEKYAQFEELATHVFQRLVRSSKPHEAAFQHAYDSARFDFAKQLTVLDVLVEKANKTCDQIREKVASAKNIQSDLAELLQTLKVLGSCTKLKEELEKIDPTHRNEIWRHLTPLYKRIEKITAHVRTLQDNQTLYLKHGLVVNHLKSINTDLTPNTHILCAHLSSIQHAASELSRILKSDDPSTSTEIQAMIKRAETLSTNITREKGMIAAIYALLPPKTEKKKGILEQFQHLPTSLLSTIDKLLASFTQDPNDRESIEERQLLARIIDDGSHLANKFQKEGLGEHLQRIYARHCRLEGEATQKLRESLEKDRIWLATKIAAYETVSNTNHAKMQKELSAILAEMTRLKQGLANTSPSLTFPISGKVWKGLAGALPFAGVYVGGPAGPLLAAAGSSYLAFTQESSESNQHAWQSLAQKGALVVGAALGSWYLPPQAERLISIAWNATGAFAGYSLTRAVKDVADYEIFKRVWPYFQGAWKMMRDSRGYKALTTRAMMEMKRTKT